MGGGESTTSSWKLTRTDSNFDRMRSKKTDLSRRVKSANYLAIIFNEHAERLTAVGGKPIA